jgi:tRNA-2-methylthio-N6-dimethylallyladenosine synthase
MELESFYIHTFGCQMNVHDSERLAGQLRAHGLSAAADPGGADVVLVNTCSVREKAEDKLLSELGRLRRFKRRRRQVLAVCGCVSQRLGERLLRRAPFVDIVMGPDAIPRLWENLMSVVQSGMPVVDTDLDSTYSQAKDRYIDRSSGFQAWLPVMEGCDNFCAYCIVPHVRGRERSRPSEDVIAQARRLVARGVVEITLLGQNVNSYSDPGGPAERFPELLRALDAIPGLQRLRFVTSHPKDLSPALIAAMAECPTVCESLHLPFQSGSNRILRAMNRRYTRETYLELIRRLRERIPDIALSADVIVGFPGERETDHLQTLELIREVRFHTLFSFRYSVRPGTKAEKLGDPVPPEVKRERLLELNEIQRAIGLELRRAEIGRTVEVLVEDHAKRGEELLVGRTRGNVVVNFAGPAELIGRIAHVEIEDATPNCLYGRLADALPGLQGPTSRAESRAGAPQ